MEKIDISKIRGKWDENKLIDGNPNRIALAGGDDTIESIRMVAEKLNEVIDKITKEIQPKLKLRRQRS